MSQQRFNWVFQEKKHGPDQCFDYDVFLDSRAAVMPTKGSIVPGWLLLVPRVQSLSISEIASKDRKLLLDLASEAASLVSDMAERVFMFEHGPVSHASPVGCGVDQAHLHVVPLGFDLISYVLDAADGMNWEKIQTPDPWSVLQAKRDYYLISDSQNTYVSYPQKQYSQYFRRKIADALQRGEEWDYRQYPNQENAQKTVDHIVGRERRKRAA